MNEYGFAAGDPIDYSDPFGLTCKVEGNCTQSDVAGPGMTTWEKVKAWYKWEGGKRAIDLLAMAPLLSIDPEGAGSDDAAASQDGVAESSAKDASPAEEADGTVPGTDKQFGKKFGEHWDSDLPGYRTPGEYRKLANEIYKDPASAKTVLKSGETQLRRGNDLLRLDSQGNFRSLYPVPK